ncbi:hypothetical protein [Streptomyces zhihengii]|uniref:Uncharacterized protein n=1 Tax=Streptomyces zhihengii TaxID=1818004 RepID=A0ABS2V4I9_9ACTN|nr:hypothetical protein [Streptomyces zhihengii]MBM9624761.1 hypothetical protein [Streptomyces zhihengii]
MSSVNAEGQSISCDSSPVTGQAGALPELSSFSRWKRRLFQALNRPARQPRLYSSSRRAR